MARLPNPAKGYNANAFITSAIAIRGEEININPRNLQASISSAASRESPSLRPSTMPQNFSDDDDEICSWIYRTSRSQDLHRDDTKMGGRLRGGTWININNKITQVPPPLPPLLLVHPPIVITNRPSPNSSGSSCPSATP
jgi:hypothetical protein